MKFSVAVGILSQAFPVVSEGKLSSGLDSRRRLDRRSHDRKGSLKTIFSSTGASTFKQGRARKRSVTLFSDRTNASRQLVNPPSRSFSGDGKGQVCDPSSTDPDIGILSCGPKAKCRTDKGSVLGGFCVPSAYSSRHDDLKESMVKNLSKFHPTMAGTRKLNDPSSKSSITTPCDPFSSDPDTGILSCGNGRTCQPTMTSSLGGECKDVGTRPSLTNPMVWRNSRVKSVLKAIECLPLGSDGGVTGCGVDQSCVESAESSLGGICSSSMSRHLQTGSDIPISISSFYGSLNCDISSFNNATETGVVSCVTGFTCFGSRYYGCYDVCANETTTYTFQSNQVVSLESCSEFFADSDAATSSKVCIKSPIGDSSCEAELDGQACSSCDAVRFQDGYGFSFDCTNVEDGFSLDATESLTSLPIIQACYQPVNGEICTLCSNGTTMQLDDSTPIWLSGFGDSFTCSGLTLANMNRQISAEKCPEASAVAEVECCAYQCDICMSRFLDNVTAYDPLYVSGFGETTCSEVYNAGYVNNSIPQDSCPSLRQAIGDTCCTGEYSYFCDICGFGAYIPYDKYELPVYVPGFDNVTCGNVKRLAFSSGFDFETCPVVAGSVNGTCCTDSSFYLCKICGPGAYLSYVKYDVPVYAPGLGNVTCLDVGRSAYLYSDFDADTCPALASVTGSCCAGCDNICDVGAAMQPSQFNTTVTVPGIGNYTCYDLYLSVYVGGNFSILNDVCVLREAGLSSCCAASDGYNECRLCGDGGIAFPDATVFSEKGYPLPCDYLGYVAEAGGLNETECAYFSSLAVPCCAPSMIPSAAPVEAS